MPTNKSCTCNKCVSACHNKPGWLKPGDILNIANFLGMTPKELFQKYLMVDYWVGDNNNINVLSPIFVDSNYSEAIPGDIAPFVAMGKCVFLTPDDRCSIHEVKPWECKEVICSKPDKTIHERAAMKWNNPKDQEYINKELLGDKYEEF